MQTTTKKPYNFVGKRYTTYNDEMSGIGGKHRPTTYGVYDNKRGLCIESCKDLEAATAKAIEYNKKGRPTEEIKEAAPQFAYPAQTYETGATSHPVNDLILFTDYTRSLAEWRDAIYKAHLDEERAHRQTVEYLASRFLNLFYGATRRYYAEFKNYDNVHIKGIGLSGMAEYQRLYAEDFPNWKKEHGY